jgi:hypothetical protein
MCWVIVASLERPLGREQQVVLHAFVDLRFDQCLSDRAANITSPVRRREKICFRRATRRKFDVSV